MKRNLSDEQLMELIKTLPAPANEPTDVEEFIRAMRFSSGRIRVPFSLIFAMYKQWSDQPTRRATLGKALLSRFKRVRSRYRVYYLLDRCGLPKGEFINR